MYVSEGLRAHLVFVSVQFRVFKEVFVYGDDFQRLPYLDAYFVANHQGGKFLSVYQDDFAQQFLCETFGESARR